ncbi:biotin--[acetyl-CoA-carboxylase] ligase [bacterium]|nr:MAG: biotin--[acetyl-CoA-carboxylase] ligase [bacterium]
MPDINYKLIQLEEVDSTNEYAKKLVLHEDILDTYVVVANHQTHGKGRLGRKWESPRGMGLWISIILKPGKSHEEMVWTNFMVSVTVCEALKELTRLLFELKWPNDILINGKKICGILTETVNKNKKVFLIIGIGININQQDFPGPLDGSATSLFIETQTVWDRWVILEKIMSGFDDNNINLSPEIITRWKSLSGMLGHRITVVQGDHTFEAMATDIAKDGALVVERNGRAEKLYAGDVHILVN